MILTNHDRNLLAELFPDLQHNATAQKIAGELNFCAAYDRTTGKVRIERQERDATIRSSPGFISAVFDVEIRLDDESTGANGWPKVLEVGGRHQAIAERFGITLADLHFFDGGVCCLGIKFTRERNLTLERFLYELLIPFLYRLAYVDRYGITAARNDLWGEYSHDNAAYDEHRRKMAQYAQINAGRNAPCPCGSSRKYKLCCLDEVQIMLPGLSESGDGPRRLGKV